MSLIRQTIKQKPLSFWKVVPMIVGPIFIMNIVIRILSRFTPLIATFGGLATLIGAAIGCIIIIYKHVAYFNYRMIDNELIMEKVFGKANHLFLALKLNEVQRFKLYEEINIQQAKKSKVNLYRFVAGRNTQRWYVGEFTRSGERYMFIIEPNEELLNGIMSFIKESQKNAYQI
ncbi:hypothetical protein [Marinisporobacter balticus]|uniref:PH (Pleckstrin Homology) domain-containing protein n=1 Tax=Marinisporobacter balticus TaxID=2018667 RepID=A0A4R2KVT4_9FIRM|nr:hypothetical protein [Marinisporobacter balticus]TCO78621.1 hypothetical protein EV214_1044 [Marinisporobacter balticus]